VDNYLITIQVVKTEKAQILANLSNY